ncbi:MAG: permease [Verrucomicrobia bacterium]|nr:MAG: permease [Verrucomicrobiota bacterium]
MNDLRFAFRQLVKNPGFTAVAVLTLALGIGANTTAFSWIQTVLLRSVPGVAESDRLVVIAPRHVSGNLIDTMSYPDLKDLAAHQELFAGVVASQYAPVSLTMGSETEWTWAQAVTANFFDLLGVRPALGRAFLPEEESAPGGHPVVVLSHAFWQRRFSGDSNIIGRTLTLNRHAFTIVGVAAPGFRGTMGGLAFDLWAPIMMRQQLLPGGWDPDIFQARNNRWLHTIGRLAPGVSVGQARTAVETLARQWDQEYPATDRDLRFALVPMWKSPWGAPGVLLPVLSVMFAVTCLVLLIVAANIANLLLVRAMQREREIAVRLAVGASRGRVIRQLLTESVLLAVLGAAAGVPCAAWLMDLTRGMFPVVFLPVVLDPHLDVRALVFMLLAALGVGLLFGLAPAWQSARSNLCLALKEGRGAAGGRHRLRSSLVAAEIALALLLLIGAGLCLQSFRQARRVNPGFDPAGVLLANIRLGVHGYSDQEGKLFYRKLLERLRPLPGAEAVGLGDYVPLGPEGGSSTRVSPEGYVPQANEYMSLPFNIVSPGYFDTLRIPLLEGRDFTARDDASAPGAIIINEIAARRFWPGQSALGRRIKIFGNREMNVVGVAKAAKVRWLNEPASGFFYLPLEQFYSPNMNVHLRTAANPLALADTVRREVRGLDPAVQPAITLPMTEVTDFSVLTYRVAASVLTVLGATALLLALVGIYGVMAFVVNQRTPEIGIRMALGAAKADVLQLVLGQGARLALTGVAAGLVCALALTRLLSSVLVGVNAVDPLTFGGASLLLGAVALLACYLPARRAAKVDPMEALRHE